MGLIDSLEFQAKDQGEYLAMLFELCPRGNLKDILKKIPQSALSEV